MELRKLCWIIRNILNLIESWRKKEQNYKTKTIQTHLEIYFKNKFLYTSNSLTSRRPLLPSVQHRFPNTNSKCIELIFLYNFLHYSLLFSSKNSKRKEKKKHYAHFLRWDVPKNIFIFPHKHTHNWTTKQYLHHTIHKFLS